MAETQRTIDGLFNASTGILKDNSTGAISAQDLRDAVESVRPRYALMFVIISSATACTASGTYYPAAGTWGVSGLSGAQYEFNESTNGVLTYTGAEDVIAIVNWTCSMTCTGTNDILSLRIGYNGGVLTSESVATQVTRFVGTGTDVGAAACSGLFRLSTNDTLTPYVANLSAASTNIDIQGGGGFGVWTFPAPT